MIIVSYGGGINSTAMLIECVIRKIPIDLILFADTGGEKPHTYEYIKVFSDWLIKNGMPEIVTVKVESETLEEACLRKKCLPSIAYGFKSCSQRFKLEPQNKYVRNLESVSDYWKSGGRIIKFVGFDADEPHRAKDYSDKKYIVKYPLIEWDMGRKECIEAIEDEGLCVPGKSACFYCPSSRISEIKALKQQYPELADRAIKMEENAELTSVKGLGRSYSWKNALATDDMFEDNYIEIDCGCYDG